MAATSRAGSRRDWPELGTGALIVVLGAAWIWLARDYGLVGEGGRLDAGTLPALAGSVLVICGGAVILSALRRRRGGAPSDRAHLAGEADPDAAEGETRSGSKARTAFLMLLASLALVTVLGFSVSLALFTFSVLLLVERHSVPASAGAAVAMWAFGYFCFEVLLGVPLPQPIVLDA